VGEGIGNWDKRELEIGSEVRAEGIGDWGKRN